MHLPVSSSVPSFVPSKLVAAAASCWRRWQCASIASERRLESWEDVALLLRAVEAGACITTVHDDSVLGCVRI